MFRPIAILFVSLLLSQSVFARESSSGRGSFDLWGFIKVLSSGPVTDNDFTESLQDPKVVDLGRLLFNDKILSGNKNISCATCHHVTFGTSDGLSLSVGEGGSGLGPFRSLGEGADLIHERVPRNAPALFNLGASAMTVMFHDGRVTEDYTEPQGFLSPAGQDLPPGLSGPVAVQALFPMTSAAEMAGQAGENAIADAAAVADFPSLWELVMERLRGIPEYVEIFKETFDDIDQAQDMTITHVANAIAAWESQTFRTTDSPFDKFLSGNYGVLSNSQLKGMLVFFGSGKCSTCHRGKFQTDMDFHSIAMPQFGPGKGDGVDGFEDFGRERVTGNIEDRYRFRTPSLRNVTLTGPWGHDGAYSSLEGVIDQHLNPVSASLLYDARQAVLPASVLFNLDDYSCLRADSCKQSIASSSDLKGPTNLTPEEIRNLVAFMYALTDSTHSEMPEEVPETVPSGLSVD